MILLYKIILIIVVIVRLTNSDKIGPIAYPNTNIETLAYVKSLFLIKSVMQIVKTADTPMLFTFSIINVMNQLIFHLKMSE